MPETPGSPQGLCSRRLLPITATAFSRPQNEPRTAPAARDLSRVKRMTTPRFHTYRELRVAGWSRPQIDRAVREGALIRLRRGRYAEGSLDPTTCEAGRLGGRVDCVSLLSLLGVFVLHAPQLHVQFDREMSRLPDRPPDVVAHWRSTGARPGHLHADLVEALAEAFRCQGPRAGLASVDSAWNKRLITREEVDAVFARLPRRFRRLRALADRSAEAGSETFVRLMLRSLGARFETQVRIAGVGRVDFWSTGG